MAVGLIAPTAITAIRGIQLATTAAGIRYPDRDDMLLISLAEGSTVAGVFTQNKFCAAPVTLARENLSRLKPRALLVNSGNANAGTGAAGMQNSIDSCARVASGLGINDHQVLPFSTGVIGEQLPMDRVLAGIDDLLCSEAQNDWLDAAKAIMTTDTVAKAVSETISIEGQEISVSGIAKGSGMICPNMATLLSYVATDATVSQEVLQSFLERAANVSFNRITVDSDTSTNDALMLIATGKNDVSPINSVNSVGANSLYLAIEKVFTELATSIIRDAEGATKFVNVRVINGNSEADCREIAYSVAHSPLVKTALFASDPNWGRLLMAVGKADVDGLDIARIALSINDLLLIENGEPAADYSEVAGQSVFEQSEIEIVIDLNNGQQAYNVWTSDLSHEYVSINADYRS